jgi:polar amino acid transport system permease protein
MALTMASSIDTRTAGVADTNIIKVVPRRRPWVWLLAFVVLAVVALFAYSAARDTAYDWPTYRRHLLDREFGRAALVTLELTGIATGAGLVLGALLAAMRVSGNVVLRTVAWAYMWIFRAVPVYLQLVFWGLATELYGHLGIGVPFSTRLASVDTTTAFTAFVAACTALALNAGAYLGEVFRAGVTSVDVSQREAAAALGMSPGLLRRRVVWPLASRIIVPGTIGQVVTTVKVTALVVAVPLTTDLYGRSVKTALLTHHAVPLLLDAATWYLVIVSALMLIQFAVQRRMNRDPSRPMSAQS